jgi:hypothetical protein
MSEGKALRGGGAGQRPGEGVKAQPKSEELWKPKGLGPSAQEPAGISQSPFSEEDHRPLYKVHLDASLGTCSLDTSLR